MQPGFAAGFGNTIVQEPNVATAWQRVMQGRLALQQAARQQQASEAFFASLVTPPAGALPQQGGGAPPTLNAQRGSDGSFSVPGSVPQASPSGDPSYGLMAGPMAGTPSSGGAAPTAPAGGAPAPSPTPSAPVSPSASAPAGGSPTPGPAAGGLQFPDPMVRLRQLAQSIKRANPGMDNATLAMALDKAVSTARGLAPDDRAMLQAETQIMRIQAQSDNAVQRAQS